MAKQKKPRVTNEEVIERLCTAGFGNGPWKHDNEYRTAGPFGSVHKKGSKSDRPTYLNEDRLYRHWWTPTTWSYMIPVDIYKKHVASNYRVMIPIGQQVRMRKDSTRTYERSEYANDLADTKDFDHLGIGTGKVYKSDRVEEQIETLRKTSGLYSVSRNFSSNTMRVLIGNDGYPANLIHALQRTIKMYENGIRKPQDEHWWHNRNFQINDFLDSISIKGDGFFGHKQLINGTISNVYVHFLYPKWKVKRESRFEVLFETGARGIFTSDYLDVVYDTDYDVDESLVYCNSVDPNDPICFGCSHRTYHKHTSDCDSICWKRKRNTCVVEYNYSTLIDTTCGKALNYVEEK